MYDNIGWRTPTDTHIGLALGIGIRMWKSY